MADGAIETTAIMLAMRSKAVHASASTLLSMVVPVADCVLCFDPAKFFPFHMSVNVFLCSACIHACTAERICFCQNSRWEQLV